MKAYLDLLADVCKLQSEERVRKDRTGTGTFSTFGKTLDIDLRKGFPVLTTKYIHLHSVSHELAWFLSGSTNIKYLRDNGVTIWNEWSTPLGNLGPVYGSQWRDWKIPDSKDTIDQIEMLLSELTRDPYSRRHIVSAWNPAYTPIPRVDPETNVYQGRMALAPCHSFFQVYVQDMPREDMLLEYAETMRIDIDAELRTLPDYRLESLMKEAGIPMKYLDLQLYMRSTDIFLGLPFNIASYAKLTHLVAHALGYKARNLHIRFGDLHLYKNHVDQANEQLTRSPGPLPTFVPLMRRVDVMEALVNRQRYVDIPNAYKIAGYHPQSSIKAPISV